MKTGNDSKLVLAIALMAVFLTSCSRRTVNSDQATDLTEIEIPSTRLPSDPLASLEKRPEIPNDIRYSLEKFREYEDRIDTALLIERERVRRIPRDKFTGSIEDIWLNDDKLSYIYQTLNDAEKIETRKILKDFNAIVNSSEWRIYGIGAGGPFHQWFTELYNRDDDSIPISFCKQDIQQIMMENTKKHPAEFKPDAQIMLKIIDLQSE